MSISVRGQRYFQLSLNYIGFIIILSLPYASHAEQAVFIKEYTYMASDIDSKVSSRAIALEQVKRALVEQLGVYLTSETVVKNFQMTKDQITTLATGIVSAEVVEEKWDGRSYYLKAKISADPSEVATRLDAYRMNEQLSKELELSRITANEAMTMIEQLKMDLKSAKANANVTQQYSKIVDELSASDWYERGHAFYSAEDFQSAIQAFSNAIMLNPRKADYYFWRGNAGHWLKGYQLAIDDLSRAIEIETRGDLLCIMYSLRADTFLASGDAKRAIQDLNKAIACDPDDGSNYRWRGDANARLGKNRLAIRDYNKAIALNPADAESHYRISGLHSLNGDVNSACINLRKARDLGFENWEQFKTDKNFSKLRQAACYSAILLGR